MVTDVHEYETEKGFNLRLEARLKNAALVRAREQRGLTAKQAAEAIGINYSSYVRCETMGLYPGPDTRIKICNFYVLLEEEVFPEELRKIQPKKLILEREIPRSKLLSLANASHMHLLPPVTLEQELEKEELRGEIEKVLDSLNPREAKVLRLHYGFKSDSSMTYKQIGEIMGISSERVRQIHNKAISRIRGEDKWGRRVGRDIGKRLETYLEDLSR